MMITNTSHPNWDDDASDGPPLHTRIIFASAWIFIAVIGILGRNERILSQNLHFH